MTARLLRRAFAASALAALLFAAAPAEAQSTRDKVIETLVGALKATGAKDVTYGTVSGDDARFTIKDIRLVIESEGKAATMTSATATYVGAVPTADGGYTADEILIDDLAIVDDDVEVKIASFKIDKYVGQAPAKVAESGGLGDTFERIAMTDLTIDGKDDPVVPVASVVITAGGHVDGIPHRGSLDIRGITVPVDENNPEAQEIIALGYKQVVVDVVAKAGWDEKAERLSLDELVVSGKDMGTVRLAFAFGSVTAEALKALKEAKDDSAKQMEILQGFSIESIAVRFDNASLVDRMLDAQAKAGGATREQYVTGLAAAVPLMIAAINNKAFEAKVAAAVGSFLKAPGSIAASAKPKAPVPVAQLVGTAMVAPQTIPDILAVDIQANK